MTRMTAGPPCCGSTGAVRTTAVSVSIHVNTYLARPNDTDDCGADGAPHALSTPYPCRYICIYIYKYIDFREVKSFKKHKVILNVETSFDCVTESLAYGILFSCFSSALLGLVVIMVQLLEHVRLRHT